ncbi:winged helix-turn-helix domain-containing protein [Streptomyces anandii]|uniref:helix-turn-helix domain-containing protein n=1 Tax=Streptomyces anandii TaxID=285454 RepID=UPI0036FD1A62
MFGYRYTPRGVSYLLHRLGWSPQVPAHRAVGRDEQAVARWWTEQWSRVRGRPSSWARGSFSSCAVRRCVSCGGERPSPLTCRSREVELRAA